MVRHQWYRVLPTSPWERARGLLSLPVTHGTVKQVGANNAVTISRHGVVEGIVAACPISYPSRTASVKHSKFAFLKDGSPYVQQSHAEAEDSPAI